MKKKQIYSSTCDYISDNNLLRNLNGHRLKYSKHFRSVYSYHVFLTSVWSIWIKRKCFIWKEVEDEDEDTKITTGILEKY